MFLDIRDFTRMAEKMEPEELIEYQNRVFGFMIDAVQRHNGSINQFLGDGFMATFGEADGENPCDNGYRAAMDILDEIRERNRAGAIVRTKVGIGLHAGYVVTGNVGTDIRKQYSITGNTVIIASRVEQLNKHFKTQLLITREVHAKLSAELRQEKVAFEEASVKGRTAPLEIVCVA